MAYLRIFYKSFVAVVVRENYHSHLRRHLRLVGARRRWEPAEVRIIRGRRFPHNPHSR